MGKAAFLGLGLLMIVVAIVVYVFGRNRYEDKARLVAMFLSCLTAIMLAITMFLPAKLGEYTVVYEKDGQLTLLDESTGGTRKVDLGNTPHDAGIGKGAQVFVLDDVLSSAQYIGLSQNLATARPDAIDEGG